MSHLGYNFKYFKIVTALIICSIQANKLKLLSSAWWAVIHWLFRLNGFFLLEATWRYREELDNMTIMQSVSRNTLQMDKSSEQIAARIYT